MIGHRQITPSTWASIGVCFALVYLLFLGVPLVGLVVRAAEEQSFWPGFTTTVVLDSLRISLLTSLISVIVIAIIGTPLAYVLTRYRFPGHSIVDALIELPIALPPVVVGLALLMTFGRNGFLGGLLEPLGVSIPFTLIAVIIAQIFVGAPFYLRSAILGFQAVNPDLEDTAKTLGFNTTSIFVKITFPLARRALFAGLALAWARGIAEFGATILFAGGVPGKTQTMPVAILQALEIDLGAALALAVILVLLASFILIIVRRLTETRLGVQS